MKRWAAAAVVSMAVMAGACGSGGGGAGDGVASIDGTRGGTGDAAAGSEKQTFEEAALAFSRCMRKHGVDMPDPGEGGMLTIGPDDTKDVAPEAMEEAEAACKKEREAMQGSMGDPPADFQDKMLAMARCMRDNGIDMPDPNMTADGKASVEIDPGAVDDPKFQAAQDACRKQVGMQEPGVGGRP